MSRRLNKQNSVEGDRKEQFDKHSYSKIESELQSGLEDDLVKISDGAFDFLNKRYPISMNLLRKIFGRET